jgi:hypothetical protein
MISYRYPDQSGAFRDRVVLCLANPGEIGVVQVRFDLFHADAGVIRAQIVHGLGLCVIPIPLLIERPQRYLAAIPRPEIGSGSDNATLNVMSGLHVGARLRARAGGRRVLDLGMGRRAHRVDP